MKQQSYLLKIDKPCSENWTLMTTNELGKFCSHCSKNVIDFTNLCDNEILKIIENTDAKLCGRFDKTQLNKILVKAEVNPARTVYSKILAGFLLFTSANKSEAKETAKLENVRQINSLTAIHNLNSLEHTEEVDSTKNLIKGKVVDVVDNNGLPGVAIRLKDTNFHISTNANGKFEFILPDSLLTEKLEFQITYIGYITESFIVYKKDFPLLNDFLISLKEDYRMLGEVVIIKKKKWWQRKNKTSNH